MSSDSKRKFNASGYSTQNMLPAPVGPVGSEARCSCGREHGVAIGPPCAFCQSASCEHLRSVLRSIAYSDEEPYPPDAGSLRTRAFVGLGHDGEPQGTGQERVGSEAREWGQKIQGQCPACGCNSLFLGNGGYVTCAILGCPAPCAATDALVKAPGIPVGSEARCQPCGGSGVRSDVSGHVGGCGPCPDCQGTGQEGVAGEASGKNRLVADWDGDSVRVDFVPGQERVIPDLNPGAAPCMGCEAWPCVCAQRAERIIPATDLIADLRTRIAREGRGEDLVRDEFGRGYARALVNFSAWLDEYPAKAPSGGTG